MCSLDMEIVPVDYELKSVLQRLIELYQYDSSEFEGYDVNPFGLYGYKYLDHYWTEEGRHPFFIKVNENYAGFALINRFCYTDAEYSFAEFFVMRKYRKQGVGTFAAKHLLDIFSGEWEVIQTKHNLPAQQFWKKLISSYTNHHFKEFPQGYGDWTGPILRFSTAR